MKPRLLPNRYLFTQKGGNKAYLYLGILEAEVRREARLDHYSWDCVLLEASQYDKALWEAIQNACHPDYLCIGEWWL